MARALILAAGRGERMRPLTDATPKPLLRAGGKPLIQWQVERLVAGGFTELVINHSHLGLQIEEALGDGARYGARIRYSHEPTALETAGGVAHALHLLGEEPFVVVSGDINTAFDYASLTPRLAEIAASPQRTVAHLVMVDNPPWHARGDEMAVHEGRIVRGRERLTYGNIGAFHPCIFSDVPRGSALRMFPWAYGFVDAGRVSGEHFRGAWDNIGTPDQLAALDRRLSR
ncbi:MAG TPA: nucleotidyltransferase family protein [Usitatibacter sp.]|nr:nucleotidyltransferase family protein [Usitatibacter sp.]